MTSINKRLLEVKINDTSSKIRQPKMSWKKMGKERTKKVIELLSAAQGELHFNYLAKQLNMKPISMKDWLLRQMKIKQERCPWKNGKNKSYFVLR